MKTWKTIDLKSHGETVDFALKFLEIEIELARKEGITGLKILHGYGSGGKGGGISLAIKPMLLSLQKQKKIVVIPGSEWNVGELKTSALMCECPDCYGDEDLNRRNPGITVLHIL